MLIVRFMKKALIVSFISISVLVAIKDPNVVIAQTVRDDVEICHRTHSTENPYSRITVSQSSIGTGPGQHGGKSHDDYSKRLFPDGKPYPNVFDSEMIYEPASEKLWGDIIPLKDINGKRVATAYPGLVQSHLANLGISADVVRLDGAVESSVRLGVADLIADVVSTGNTLRQAGLEIFGDPILTSEAILISRSGVALAAELEVLIRRLQGVVTARQYVLLDYDIKKIDIDSACAITPGLESPTISPLQNLDWLAVRAMVLRSETNKVMDELYALGARGILVTDIHACRL